MADDKTRAKMREDMADVIYRLLVEYGTWLELESPEQLATSYLEQPSRRR